MAAALGLETVTESARQLTMPQDLKVSKGRGDTNQTALEHIPALDGLRAIAVLLVVVYHAWRYTGTNPVGRFIGAVAHIGWCGVDVFFVISGFLITRILISSKVRPNYFRRFWFRRALRIFPLYYFVLTIVALFMILEQNLHLRANGNSLAGGTLGNIIWNYLYLPNFIMAIYGHDAVPLSITWSLAIEEQYYLVFPFVVFFTSESSLFRLLLCAVPVASICRVASFYFTGGDYLPAYLLPFCRMDALAIGGLVALLWMRGYEISLRTYRIGMAIGIAIFLRCYALSSRGQLDFIAYGYTIVPILTALTILGIRSGHSPWLNRALNNRLLRAIGRISYGIYLYHTLIVGALMLGMTRVLQVSSVEANLTHAFILVFSTIIVALAVAQLSWSVLESPILRLKDSPNAR